MRPFGFGWPRGLRKQLSRCYEPSDPGMTNTKHVSSVCWTKLPLVSNPVCDIHGQGLKVQQGWGEFPVRKPQNWAFGFCSLGGSVAFIRPWPSACSGLQLSVKQMGWRSVSTSKSKVMVLCQKTVGFGSELMLQEKEFKHIRILFTSDGRK